MLTRLADLIEELRRVGLPVSTTEQIDAARSLEHVVPPHRDGLRAALGCTLVKQQRHRQAFDTVFDLFFPESGLHGTASDDALRTHLTELDDEALNERLRGALEERDDLLLAPLVVELVNRHARVRPGQPVAGNFHVFRVLRATDPADLRERLIGDATTTAPTAALDRRLRERRADDALEVLRQEIEAEVRRRLVSDRGASSVAQAINSTLPEDVDFLTAATKDLVALEESLSQLPAQLAQALAARRRRLRQGRLDVRRTVRGSMSTGGVPVNLQFRPPHPRRPELVVLADISGSVATFARFTLLLTHAMRSQFSRVRSFVFIDGVDEVTSILAEADNVMAAADEIDRSRAGVHLDGSSDYGNALRSFVERWCLELSQRDVVLILGDARSNYRRPAPEALRRLRERVGRVYWLNPEPAATWNDGDSVMAQYAPWCDLVVECRNIRQLQHFIEQLD